jgi:hypothetical protein
MSLLDTSLIFSHSSDHDKFLLMAETPKGNGRVWQEEEQDYAECCAHCTDDEKFVPP